MGTMIVFDGSRKRTVYQEASARNSLALNGNQHTQRRLPAAILSARSLRGAAQKLGGEQVLLAELKRMFERRAA